MRLSNQDRELLATVGLVAGLVVSVVLLLTRPWWAEWGAKDDRDAIITSILFHIIGFIVICLTKKLVNVKGEALFVSILFMPLVAYLILTGKIAQVTGPGGVGADFSSSLSQDAIEIAQLGEDVVEATPGLGDEPVCGPLAFTNPSAQLVPTPSAGESEEEPAEPTALPDVRGGPVLFLQVELSPQDCEYDPYELAIDIYRQSTSDEFKFVVLVYENDIFEAYVPSLVAIELFDYRNEDKLRAIVDAINRTPDDLRNGEEFPGIVFDTISVQDTNLEALQEMDRRDLDALVVIDAKSRLKGVVSREQVLGSMMLELASRDE